MHQAEPARPRGSLICRRPASSSHAYVPERKASAIAVRNHHETRAQRIDDRTTFGIPLDPQDRLVGGEAMVAGSALMIGHHDRFQ